MVNLKQTALTISIAFVMLLFVYYGIETFYPSPEYERCSVVEPHGRYPYEYQNCTLGTSSQERSCYEQEGSPIYDYNSTCPVYTGCNFCYKELREEQKVHDRNVFIIASIIGIAAILLGTLKLTLESVSTGVMGGGVLSVIYGTVRYWGYAENAMKFVALGLVLGILIWIGYKKLRK